MRLSLTLALVAASLTGCAADRERPGLQSNAPNGARSDGIAGSASVRRNRPADFRRTRVIGRSVEGRPIELTEVGERAARTAVLVVGCIHGTECEGMAVGRRLARGAAVTGVRLAVVETLNPDGLAIGVRQNARGVDLNRNFPSEWRAIGAPFDPEHSGERPLSEPETRVAVRLIRSLRPDVTVWFHQPQANVRAFGDSVPAARRYARTAGVRYRTIRWPPGTAPNWQNQRLGMTSFVIELPPGSLPAAAAARHARALRDLARQSASDAAS